MARIPGLPRPTEYLPFRAYEPYPASYAQTSEDGDPTELLRKLWRRKGLVVGVTGAAVLIAAFTAALLTQRYTAESLVLVGIQQPKVTNIEDVLKGLNATTEAVQSEAYVMASRGLAERVVNRFALDKDPEFNPELRSVPIWRRYLDDASDALMDGMRWLVSSASPSADEAGTGLAPTSGGEAESAEARRRERVVSNLLAHVDVSPLNRSHVLAVDVTSENPIVAARIANSLADVYIEQQTVDKTNATERANSWLDQHIGALRAKAESDERAVEEFRRANGLYETKTDTVVAQQIGELNGQLISAQNAEADAEANLAQAKKALANPEAIDSLPAVLQSPLIQSLREKQVEMERQAAQLASTYGRKHPAMIDMEAQLKDVKRKIQDEVRKIVAGLEHEADSAKARYQALESSLLKLQGSMGANNEKSVRLHDLEREADASRTLLQSFLERSKETGVSAGLTYPDATVISPANIPDSPSFPPVSLMLAIAALAGGGLGVLLALLTENLDRTFRTSQEAEEITGFPTLALVPALGWRARGATNVLRNPDSPFSESLRTLYAKLLLSGTGAEIPKIVMLTSATPDEGKSRIGYSLAQLVAVAGRRVIVVDCDWKRPTLHKLFRAGGRPGLAELLRGDATPEETVHQDRISGAHAIFAGSTSQNSHDILRFERLPQLLETLARHYDLIIVDTPPVLAGSEVAHLARMMHSIVFVVKWGETQREVALNGLKQIVEARGQVAGVVLSQVDPKRYRRYGYGDMAYYYER